MRIKNLYIIAAPLLMVGFGACKKDNTITPPAPMSEFINSATVGSYYVTSDPNTSFAIPVGITNLSDNSRSVSFSVTSSTGATAGQQYTLPGTTVTIPGKIAVDSIRLKGIFAGYPAGRKDTLTFKLTGGDVGVFTGYETYKVVLQRYCTVVLANLGGNYTKTYENGSYGPYTVTITGLTSTGATTATGKINNLYDSGISANVVFNWTDPSAFSATIAPQATGFTSGGLPLMVRTINSPNTFSSCDNTIRMQVQLYTTAGEYDHWEMTTAK